MKKFLILLIILIPFSIKALEYPKVNSKIIEIYDLNDQQILYEVQSNNKVSVASLTKIATAITAIEDVGDLNQKNKITTNILSTVSNGASVAGLQVGDIVTYKDLLYALMLPSGADAANAIAILSSGSTNSFVKEMNDLANKLNLKNTHFVNVTGLDMEGNYSTADDMRILLEYALKNQTFKEIYTTKQYTLPNGKIIKSTLYKYKASASAQEKIIGSKSGFTNDAGYCLASLSNINGHDMITIVLNAEEKDNKYYNIVDTITLIDFMNDHYKDEVLIEKNKLIKTIPVDLSKIDNYKIYSNKEIKKYLPDDYDIKDFKIKYDGLDKLSYKNHKGDKIGVIKYYFKDKLLLKQDIILDQQIEISIPKIFKKYHILIISLCFLFISLFVTLLILKIKHKRKKYKH